MNIEDSKDDQTYDQLNQSSKVKIIQSIFTNYNASGVNNKPQDKDLSDEN